MKNTSATLGLLVAGLFLSCEKPEQDVLDYYPVIKTLSAVVQPDGSVEVSAEITSEGAAQVEYAGFCVDTVPNPDMLSGQALASSVSGNTFSAIYTGFEPNKRYYFRSWATNDYGYVYGNTISVDDIQATPVEPPCTLALNTVNVGGTTPTQTFYSVDLPENSWTYWDFDAKASSTTLGFRFGSKLKTGLFTTTTGMSPAEGQVSVTIYSGMISGGLSSGSTIYVSQKGPETWEIAICNAPWKYNNSEFYLNTRFTCPK